MHMENIIVDYVDIQYWYSSQAPFPWYQVQSKSYWIIIGREPIWSFVMDIPLISQLMSGMWHTFWASSLMGISIVTCNRFWHFPSTRQPRKPSMAEDRWAEWARWANSPQKPLQVKSRETIETYWKQKKGEEFGLLNRNRACDSDHRFKM